MVFLLCVVFSLRAFNARFGPTAADRDILAPKHLQKKASPTEPPMDYLAVNPGAGDARMDYTSWSSGLGQLDQYAVDRHRRDAFNLLASLAGTRAEALLAFLNTSMFVSLFSSLITPRLNSPAPYFSSTT